VTPDVSAIRARLSKATPGLWQLDGPFWWRGGDANPDCTTVITAGDNRMAVAVLPEDHDRQPTADADADLIAHAPTDLAALLAEVERLRTIESVTEIRFRNQHNRIVAAESDAARSRSLADIERELGDEIDMRLSAEVERQAAVIDAKDAALARVRELADNADRVLIERFGEPMEHPGLIQSDHLRAAIRRVDVKPVQVEPDPDGGVDLTDEEFAAFLKAARGASGPPPDGRHV